MSRSALLALCTCLACCGVGALLTGCGEDAAGTSIKYDTGLPDTGDLGNNTGLDTTPPPEDTTLDLGDTFVAVPCGRNADCPAGQVCLIALDSDGSVQLTCGAPIGPGGAGADCTDDADCESGLCLNGICASPCVGGGCPAGMSCDSQPVGSGTLDTCIPGAEACASNAACDGGDVCVVDRSAALLDMACGAPVGTGVIGTTCAQDAGCQSNLCLGGQCTAPCERNNDCSSDGSWQCRGADVPTNGGNARINVCQETPATACSSDAQCSGGQRCVATKGGTVLSFSCGTPNNGGGESGATCTSDTGCAQNLCVNAVCAGPCQTASADCPATFGCDLVDVSVGGVDNQASLCQPPVLCEENDACLVSEVCYFERQGGSVSQLCHAPNLGGADLGQLCTDDVDCGANLCFDGRFQRICTRACINNSDCTVPGYQCTEVDVRLSGASGSQTWGICTAQDPPTCQSQPDCVAGTVCAVVANDNAPPDGLEAVCIPEAGGSTTGVPCTSDANCGSLVCLGGFCSTPCNNSNQCGQGQLCLQNTLTKGGLTGSFDVCETLVDQACTATSDCSDGVRVCGELRVTTNAVELFCTFPNTGEGGLGEACTTDGECFHNLCLDTANECSVGCDADGECLSGQLCTSYHYSRGPSDVGVCARACVNNADCTGGNVCTVNANYRDDVIDQVCEAPAGNGDTGTPCTNGNACISGLCLTMFSFNGTGCAQNTDCIATAGATCEELFDGSGNRECATTESRCTELCDPGDGNADCADSVFPSNPLVTCSSGTTIRTPVSNTRQTLSTCAR